MAAINEYKQACKDNFFSVKTRLTGTTPVSDMEFFKYCLLDLWSSFDGYLSWKFTSTTPKKMRQLFCNKYQSIFETWPSSINFINNLQTLYDNCPVEDMRLDRPESPMSIDNKNNLFQILNLSYRVRSNLIHGSKIVLGNTPQHIRNRKLVESSTKVTYHILENVLSIEQII